MARWMQSEVKLEFGMIMYCLGAALYRRFVSFGLL